MVKLLISAVLALTASNEVAGNKYIYEDNNQQDLTASNEVAGNKYIYKDKGGQVLLTNVNPSGNFDKFTKKVKVTYYRDKDNTGLDTKKRSSSGSYANSAYAALR